MHIGNCADKTGDKDATIQLHVHDLLAVRHMASAVYHQSSGTLRPTTSCRQLII